MESLRSKLRTKINLVQLMFVFGIILSYFLAYTMDLYNYNFVIFRTIEVDMGYGKFESLDLAYL